MLSAMKLPGGKWSRGDILAVVGAAAVLSIQLTWLAHWDTRGLPPREGNKPPEPDVPEIVKKDCQRLVDGLLLFEPSTTMRQGQAYPVFARLTRDPGVNITEGLEASKFVIVAERVSCKVSMNLDSEEAEAFKIEKVPESRKDEQLLEPDKYSEWDWRVTPKKHGSLHLLLYVTPMLYVDGIGEGLKEFKQPPKVITVTPDYWYAVRQFLKDNWTIISGVLSLIVIPLILWFRKEILDWLRRQFGKKPPIGFRSQPPAPTDEVTVASKDDKRGP
jgi:hypothetical protein